MTFSISASAAMLGAVAPHHATRNFRGQERMSSYRWDALSGVVLLMIGLGTPAARAQEDVNLYSSRHYDTDVALYDQFAVETGIVVNLIEGSEDELIERIKAEGQNSPADILITVDAGRLWRADQAGILQPVSSEVLEERIPANLRHPEGKWF